MLESLLALILAIEQDFGPHAPIFLPQLLECLQMSGWETRKMAVDVIYTMAAILKNTLAPYKAEILEVLNHSKSDKYKPVREASMEALLALKEVDGARSPLISDKKQPAFIEAANASAQAASSKPRSQKQTTQKRQTNTSVNKPSFYNRQAPSLLE